jgi:hypothetical protein
MQTINQSISSHGRYRYRMLKPGINSAMETQENKCKTVVLLANFVKNIAKSRECDFTVHHSNEFL